MASFDVINVADMPRGTEGTPAGDDAAFQSALNSTTLYGRKSIVFGSPASGPVRSYQLTTQHIIPEGTEIFGVSPDQVIQAVNPQPNSSMFLVTGGRTAIHNMRLVQPGSYQSFDAIQVSKPHDGVKHVFVHDIFANGFRNIVRWQDGDCPQMERISGLGNKVGIVYANNGTSGYHQDLVFQGGGGIEYTQTSERLSQTGSLGVHGAEGITFIGCDFLQAVATGVDGQPANPPFRAQGLSFTYFAMTGFSEVATGHGIILAGTSQFANAKIKFDECWTLGRRADANGVGMFITGATTQVTYAGGEISGFQSQGVAINGDVNNPSASAGFLKWESTLFTNNGSSIDGRCDLFSAYASERIDFENCRFDSNYNPYAIYEIGGFGMYGRGNWFRKARNFSSGRFNFTQSSGPAATPQFGIFS